ARQEPEKDIYQKSHDQARGLKTERVAIIFIHKYFTQFIPGKQEGYATTTESLPQKDRILRKRGRYSRKDNNRFIGYNSHGQFPLYSN
ncbi:hypothetical protein MAE30S32_47120, partial [Microcystis aeruginosa 11-30S32]